MLPRAVDRENGVTPERGPPTDRPVPARRVRLFLSVGSQAMLLYDLATADSLDFFFLFFFFLLEYQSPVGLL